MGKVYDKHVAPWYQKQLAASGAPKSVYRIPTREEWLKEQSSPTKLRTSPEEASHEYAVSAVKGATDLAITANKFVGYMLGHNRLVDKSGPFNVDNTPTGFMDEAFRTLKYREEDYLADHQVRGIGDALLRGGFEMLPQLPLFNAAEAGLEGAGLTKEVMDTYKAAKPLRAASVGFLTSLATGSNIKEAVGQGVGFAAFDVGGDALAKAGKAGLTRAKSFLGRMLTLGGPKSIAAMAEAGEKWLAGRGGEEALKTKISTAASGGVPLKISDPLGQAGANLLNAFAKDKFGRLYNFLNKDQKLEVMRGLATYSAKEAPVEAVAQAVDNPQAKAVVTKVVQQDLQRQAQVSPEFKATLDSLAKIGINTSELVTEEATENAAVKSGRRSIPKVIQHLAKGTTDSAEKSKGILQYVNDEAKKLGRPGPGAATINDPVFFENLRHLVGNNYKLESQHQQLVQLWGLRNEFPKDIQALIKYHMEQLYPPSKGYSPRVYNQMVQNQEKLLSDVATGLNKDVEDIKKHGAKLFRSHDQAIDPLSGKTPNRFTRELEQKAEVARIKAKVKNHPDAKKAVTKTLQVLRKHNIVKE